MGREIMSLQMVSTAMPLKEAVAVQATATQGGFCETQCTVKACGTDACPLVSKVNSLVSDVLKLNANPLLREVSLRGSLIKELKKTESSVGNPVGGGGEYQTYCNKCQGTHSSSQACKQSQKTA